MPIYEYQCAACGQVLEKSQKFSEEPLKTCPACGGALSKLISSCAFHLKGNGWYVTDYCGSRSKAAAPGDSSQGPKDAAASGEPTKPKEAPKEASKEASKEVKSAPKPETAASTKKIK
ncbi:MAG: zinc ribbon domain-containing protein [Desulfobaccales bacterium]|jgi:putative FmdB family regulatory protein